MAYFFFDDGAPDAEDYTSNYIYFDENNPEWYQKVMDVIKRFVPNGRGATDALRHEPAGCISQ